MSSLVSEQGSALRVWPARLWDFVERRLDDRRRRHVDDRERSAIFMHAMELRHFDWRSALLHHFMERIDDADAPLVGHPHSLAKASSHVSLP